MALFFISYSHKSSQDFAKNLYDRINDEAPDHIRAWIDTTGLRAGEDWRRVIDKYIRDCDGLILIVTEDSLQSHFVTYEWSYAMGREKDVIPVIDDDSVKDDKHPLIHPKIGPLQWLFTKDSNFGDRLIDRLVELAGEGELSPEIALARDGLKSPLPGTRSQSVTSLEGLEDIEGLALGVSSGHPDVSIQSAIALARLTSYSDPQERYLPGLQKAIKKRHAHTQEFREAIGAFHKLTSSPQAVEIMLQAFKAHKDYQPKDAIVSAILSNRTQAATDALIEIFPNHDEKYMPIMNRFKEARDVRIIPVVCDYVDKIHSSRIKFESVGGRPVDTRQIAVDTLALLGDHAFDCLCHILRTSAALTDKATSILFRNTLNIIARVNPEKSLAFLIEVVNEIPHVNYHTQVQSMIKKLQAKL